MANPTAYTPSYDFSAFAEANPATPLPGDRVDIELAALELTTDELIAALANIRRSDGALANGIVNADSLSADLVIGFDVQGEWATATAYAAGDGVTYGTSFYKCRVAHTSAGGTRPDLDSTTWMFLFAFDSIAVGDGSITPVKLDSGQAAGFLTVLGISDWTVNVAAGINAATAKTSLVDADLMVLTDSAASAVGKKITWANVKAAIWSAFGALLAAGTGKTTPVDADKIPLADSADTNSSKYLTWANLLAGVWTGLGALIAGGTGKTTPVDADTFALSDSAATNATKKLTWANVKAAMRAYLTDTIIIPVTGETTVLTTGTAKRTFRMPYAFTVTAVRASLTTVSSSGTPTVDINDGGTTILSTKLTIDANEKTSTTAATAAVISDTSLADDAEITIDIDVAGTGAAGLKVYLIGYRT